MQTSEAFLSCSYRNDWRKIIGLINGTHGPRVQKKSQLALILIEGLASHVPKPKPKPGACRAVADILQLGRGGTLNLKHSWL